MVHLELQLSFYFWLMFSMNRLYLFPVRSLDFDEGVDVADGRHVVGDERLEPDRSKWWLAFKDKPFFLESCLYCTIIIMPFTTVGLELQISGVRSNNSTSSAKIYECLWWTCCICPDAVAQLVECPSKVTIWCNSTDWRGFETRCGIGGRKNPSRTIGQCTELVLS